jgi:hypothetical protein
VGGGSAAVAFRSGQLGSGQGWEAPAGAFLVGQVAPAGGLQVAALLAAFAQGEVGLAAPTDQQLGGLALAVDAGTEVVLAQGVAEQPGLDGLGVVVQAAQPGQDVPSSARASRSSS